MNKRTQKIGLLTISLIFVLALALGNLPVADEPVQQATETELSPEKQHDVSGIFTFMPMLENPHFGDMMYPKARQYQISVNLSMTLPDSIANMDYLELSLVHDLVHSSREWTLRFTEATNSFSVTYGSGTINLVSGDYWRSSLDLDLLFTIEVDWDHREYTDSDTAVYVMMDDLSTQLDYYETGWSIETGLSYSALPHITSDAAGTPDIGNLNEAFVIEGTVHYNGTGLTPPASAIDIWALEIYSQYGTIPGPWEDTDYDGSGTFSITCYADDVPGQDNYSIKIVDEGLDSSATDLVSGPAPTDTYFAEQIQIQSFSRDDTDSRINIHSIAYMHVTLYYDSNDAPVTDVGGTSVSVNGVTALYSGNDGVWDFEHTEHIPITLTYDDVVITGNPAGITLVDHNAQSLVQTWDEIVVSSYSIVGGDNRVDIGNYVEVEVTLHFKSDGSNVPEGTTVTVNDEPATWQGSGVWSFTVSESTITSNVYDDVVCSGGLGITLVDQDSQSQTVIWDQIVVIGYTIVTPAGDSRVSVGTTVTIDVQLRFGYSSTDVTDMGGCTVTVNGFAAAYQSLGNWRFSTSESSMTSVEFDTVVVALSQYGITEVDNSVTLVVIWDQIVVTNSEVVGGDNRVSIDDYIQIDVTLDYDYDNTDVLNGEVTVNGEIAVHMGLGVWRINVTSDLVQMRNFTTVACTGNTHGITIVDQNGQSSSVIWDRLLVDIESNYIEPDNDITVSFTLTVTYDFDAAACTTYYIAIYKNGEFFGIFTEVNKSSFQDSDADATNNYTVYQVLEEATYGITAFTSNTESVTWLEGGSTTTTPTTTTSDTGTTATDGGWDDSMKITLIGGSATVLFGLIGLLFKADMIEKKKHKGGIVFVGVVLLALGAYAIWMFL